MMPPKKLIKASQFTAGFFILSSCAILTFFFTKLPPEVPLFYSRPWGEEQLTNPVMLWLLPGTNLIIFLGCFLLGKVLNEEKLLWQITAWTSTLFSFLSFLTILKIIILTI